MEEIGGLARQYDQDFFKDMNTETGVDLENIVYYKDEVSVELDSGLTPDYTCYLIPNTGSLLCDDGQEGESACQRGTEGRHP